MLYNIEPSVEMTGGPWCTDKELDTELIKLLSDLCLKIVRGMHASVLFMCSFQCPQYHTPEFTQG